MTKDEGSWSGHKGETSAAGKASSYWGRTYQHKGGEWLWQRQWTCCKGNDTGKKLHIKGPLRDVSQDWEYKGQNHGNWSKFREVYDYFQAKV